MNRVLDLKDMNQHGCCDVKRLQGAISRDNRQTVLPYPSASPELVQDNS